MWPRPGLAAALGLAVVAAGGCGSSPEQFPPVAEPARAPALTERPAGRVVDLPGMPEGLVADPLTGLVAVGLRNPDRLGILDGASGRLVREVPIPESPRHLQLVEPGGPVLVASERADRLAIVPLRGGEPEVIEVGKYPHDAAASGERIFVGNELGDTVSVIENGREIRRLDAPLQPGGVAASRGFVAAVGVKEREIEVYDARTLRSLGRTGAGVGPTHVVSDGTGRFFIVDTQGNSVLVVRLKPKVQVVRRIAMPGAPYGVAADRPKRRFWVTLTAENKLVELTDRRKLREFPTIRQPNTVAVDSRRGRVFVVSPKTNQLQLLSPDGGE
ncbi:MAG: YncE family protein [Thermoleophilaceae bacterium]|nr:YncE family protein [Thermoleophilaceae bacterium]